MIHFPSGQLPPVNAFWSITMYNQNSLFVYNSINRYSIGKHTDGLKYNSDDSLDIYIQGTNPGQDKEQNWLPSPANENFNMIVRLYLAQPQVFDGTLQYPIVQKKRISKYL